MTIRRPVLWAITTVLAVAPPALAHGPCDCLKPSRASPGERVRVAGPAKRGIVGYPAYRIVFNPRPQTLGTAPRRLAGEHRPDSPTLTLLDRPRTQPTRKASFRVPQVPSGRYLVLIWDGDEGGAHNTWERLTVRRASADNSAPARQEDDGGSDDGGPSTLMASAVVAIALLATVAMAFFRRPGRS